MAQISSLARSEYSSVARRSSKETMSSLLLPRENTDSASITAFLLSPTKSWILRFRYDNTPYPSEPLVADYVHHQVENESRRASLPQKAGASSEQLGGVEESIMRLSGQVSTLTRQQKYFRTRENRNFSTVHSIEGRIFNLNLMETGLMIAMAALQVFVVKMFFTGGRKGMFCGSTARVFLAIDADFGLYRLRLMRICARELYLVMTTGDIKCTTHSMHR